MKAIAAFLDEIDGHTPVAFQIGFRLFLIGAGAAIITAIVAMRVS